VLNNGSGFIGGVARVEDNLDHPEPSGKAVLLITDETWERLIWGRFGQESRSFGPILQFHARYAHRAKPHKHSRLRIWLIWRVGT
jgi:hypothetical protein